MKKYLIAALLVCNAYLAAATWQPSQTIPVTPSPNPSSGVWADVSVTYFPKTKTMVAAWADVSTNVPYYSVYNGTSWSVAAPISLGFQALNNVNLQSFPFKSCIVAAWTKNDIYANTFPYYSIFDGTTWTTPQQINGGPFYAEQDINMTYDKVTHRIVAAWAGAETIIPFQPYYAILDQNFTWTTPQLFAAPSLADSNVNLAYDKGSNEVFATWRNDSTQPTYAILTGGVWSGPGAIPPGTSFGARDEVRLVYDRMLNIVGAIWSDDYLITGYFSLYNFSPPNAWSLSASLLNMQGSTGIIENVSFGYNIDTGNVIQAWVNSGSSTSPNNLRPWFNDNGTGGPIDSDVTVKAKENVNLNYDQKGLKMFAVWGNASTNLPMFSTYQ